MADSKGHSDPSSDPTDESQPSVTPPKFEAKDRSSTPSDIQLPDELWLTILESTCTFPPEIFSGVMMNLVKNPNVTSSHLFRADILFDSGENADHDLSTNRDTRLLFQQMKAEYRPRDASIPGHERIRTIVRQLVPRNPQLDRPLVQTCLFFQRLDEDEERNLVLYIPHVDTADQMPFYHPTVKSLAFLHVWRDCEPHDSPAGRVSLSYTLFPTTSLTSKLSRTALKLLQTIHKHGQGQLAGYAKRVQLDQILPQKRYQDTYTRLKTRYGRALSERWVEVTDPGKHVFEDIGIAAYLIELWRDMYAIPNAPTLAHTDPRPPFPGFVDIGCGNGLLVFLLRSEGYPGHGFDARARKTWSTFPAAVQTCLTQNILVPAPLLPTTTARSGWHTGLFPRGTFIISNHADELTPWTPLLALLNRSAFLAIPCCSHDLAGARFRAPMRVKSEPPPPPPPLSRLTGSSAAEKKMPSAYASLCAYVASLTREVGYEPETDVLRIPSTRNACIVGRRKMKRRADGEEEGEEKEGEEKEGEERNDDDDDDDDGKRRQRVIELVERELGRSIAEVGAEWIMRAEKLGKKPGSGH
nr:trna (uracil-o(2)-)-methyltransferase [Quercus suber]